MIRSYLSKDKLLCCAEWIVASQHTEANLGDRKNYFGDRAFGGWGKRRGLLPTVPATADALNVLDLCVDLGAPPSSNLTPQNAKAAKGFLVKELARWLSSEEGDQFEVPPDLTVPNVCAAVRALHSRRSWANTQEVLELRHAAIDWLIAARSPDSDGWGLYVGADPELLPTYHAVMALDLLCREYDGESQQIEELERSIERGRGFLSDIALEVPLGEEGPGFAWKQTAECPQVSPAATALAVLSLLHGKSSANEQLATKGALWLVRERARWCRSGDGAYEVILPTEDGRFPNLALCSLACAESPIFPSHDETQTAIGGALAHIQKMWNHQLGGFAQDGYSPYVGMTRTILSLGKAIERSSRSWKGLANAAQQIDRLGFGEKIQGLRAFLLAGNLTIIDNEGFSRSVPCSELMELVIRHLWEHGGASTIDAFVNECGGEAETVAREIRRFKDSLAKRISSPSEAFDVFLDQGLIYAERRKGDNGKPICLRCDLTLSG